MTPNPNKPFDLIRAQLIRRDNEGHFCRELAFNKWACTSVFPQAVCRWIHEIGERAK